MKNKLIMLIFIGAILLINACSQQESIIDDDFSENQIQATITIDYIYKGETITITERVVNNGDNEVVKDASFELIKRIYDSQPTLMIVHGLSDKGAVYLFDDVKEHNEFIQVLNETGNTPTASIIQPFGDVCLDDGNGCPEPDPIGGGGGGTGGGISTISLYTVNNMKLYIHDNLRNELDWTSNCYRNFGPTSNQRRMGNLSLNSNSHWDFRDPLRSCLPAGIGNANDQLSSLQVSPEISSVTIYGNKDFGGHSMTFYRRDANLVPSLITANVGISGPNNFPALNNWLFIPRLSAFRIGPFGVFGNFNNRVSSIRLN